MEKELKELLGLEIAARKKESNTSSNIASVATLIAAITSFLGASYAIYMNIQTTNLQERIEARQIKLDNKQVILDRNELLGYENARISLINYQTGFNESFCTGISLEEDEWWNSYASCLASRKGVPVNTAAQTDFSSFTNYSDRFTCLKKISKNVGEIEVTFPHCK